MATKSRLATISDSFLFNKITKKITEKKGGEKTKKTVLISALLAIAILAVALSSNVQAVNATNGKDKEKPLPFKAYNEGVLQSIPAPPPFHLGFSGTGLASHMGLISLTGDEIETFDKLPPTLATRVFFTGTVTWTSSNGDIVYVKYQGSAPIGAGFTGSFQITGGTGRFAGATGDGQTWGTVEFNLLTQTGTYTQWFVGTISY
jgi:hypothetical protein